jgi:cation diffusion facilitator family transporter
VGSKRVLYAALAGNLLVAVTKGVAAAITGSSAMLSEAIHSLVDSGDQVLLLYGLRRSQLPPDAKHPLGHGRELYFWSFAVALMIFALGAGVTIYEGIHHLRHPEPITHELLNYAVLGLTFVFQGWSWVIALREIKAAKGSLGLFAAFERTKDPPAFMVFFEDTADLLGVLIAAAAVFASTHLHLVAADGLGSILIGTILGAMALGLARETKSLLIGEQAEPELRRSIVSLAREVSGAAEIDLVFAIQLSPNEVIVVLEVRFPDDMRAPQIGAEVLEIERRLRARFTEVVAVYVRPKQRR